MCTSLLESYKESLTEARSLVHFTDKETESGHFFKLRVSTRQELGSAVRAQSHPQLPF